MPRFRKKSVVIEAERVLIAQDIETPEGVMRAEPGDWLITGVAGERYPCKDEVFRATYEPVDGQAFAAFRDLPVGDDLDEGEDGYTGCCETPEIGEDGLWTKSFHELAKGLIRAGRGPRDFAHNEDRLRGYGE